MVQIRAAIVILVAGATGYTGRRIVRRLVEDGESVRCLLRPSSDASVLGPGAECVRGDLGGPGLPPSIFEGVESVISAAHIRFAPNLVASGAAAGVRRFVLFSTTWKFSKVASPEREDVLRGEEAIRSADVEMTLLRPTMIYGPGETRNVGHLRAHLSKHRIVPIFGSGECLVQPVHVNDVAEAAAQAVRRPAARGKDYALAGAEPLTYTRMVDAIASELNRTPLKVYVPIALGVLIVKLYGTVTSWFASSDGVPTRVTVDQVRRMGEDRAFDISEARDDLGFEPLTFSAGLREVFSEEAAWTSS